MNTSFWFIFMVAPGSPSSVPGLNKLSTSAGGLWGLPTWVPLRLPPCGQVGGGHMHDHTHVRVHTHTFCTRVQHKCAYTP